MKPWSSVVISNYTRVLLSGVFGLISARLVVRTGADVFGIYSLVFSTVGLGLVFESIMRKIVVPSIALANLDRAAESFQVPFSFAELRQLSLILGGACFLAMLGFSVALPTFLIIPPDLILGSVALGVGSSIANGYVVAQSAFLFRHIAEDRVHIYNGFLLSRRLVAALAAVACFSTGRERGLLAFAVVSTALDIIVTRYAIRTQTTQAPRNLDNRVSVLRVVRRFKAEIIASGLENTTRSGILALVSVLVNRTLGIDGNTTVGAATLLGGYIRMALLGFSDGIEGRAGALVSQGRRRELRRGGKMLAVITFVGAILLSSAVWVFRYELLRALLSEDAARLATESYPSVFGAVLLSATIFASTEAQMRMLYGQGLIRTYVFKHLLLAGIVLLLFGLSRIVGIPASATSTGLVLLSLYHVCAYWLVVPLEWLRAGK